MDYMNLDDRSIGMFWVVSYTMAQPACETVINWLSSSGMAELPGLQPNERVMMMQEVTPLPMSLLSGFSMNLCLKLALQMEEALFVSQVCLLLLSHNDYYICLLMPSSCCRLFLALQWLRHTQDCFSFLLTLCSVRISQ